MGKLKRSTVIKKDKSKKVNPKVTIEELLQLAEENINRYELETAYKYAKQALDIDSKSTDALQSMASIQMEMGNNESSKNIYQKLVELNPNEGFSKYMCLAQLSSELEAVAFYKKGIELMLGESEANEKTNTPGTSRKLDEEDEEDDEEDETVSKLDISTAYGSIAEIYLTDLCMENDAENLCKFYLDKSIEYDSKNSETLQLLASYWLSRDDLEQAKISILESLESWLPKYIEANESGLLVDPTEVISLTYDSRIGTTRILTEVQEYDKAITVLEQLLEEDDEVVVIWYMLGWVNYCKGDEYFSNAKFYLKKSHEMSVKIKYDQKYLDEELRNHIVELLEKLKEIPSDDEDEELEDKENLNDEDDDQFDTDSEEEDEEKNQNDNIKTIKNSTDLKPITSNEIKARNKKLTDSNNNNTVEEPMES